MTWLYGCGFYPSIEVWAKSHIVAHIINAEAGVPSFSTPDPESKGAGGGHIKGVTNDVEKK